MQTPRVSAQITIIQEAGRKLSEKRLRGSSREWEGLLVCGDWWAERVEDVHKQREDIIMETMFRECTDNGKEANTDNELYRELRTEGMSRPSAGMLPVHSHG